MSDGHAGAVLAVYHSGIDEGNTTFETQLPASEAFSAAPLPDHRFVATERNLVVGWVAAAAVSRRRVYAGVVEHSVYVDPRARGRGVGRKLLDALIASTESARIWTIQTITVAKARIRQAELSANRFIDAANKAARQAYTWARKMANSGHCSTRDLPKGFPACNSQAAAMPHLESA